MPSKAAAAVRYALRGVRFMRREQATEGLAIEALGCKPCAEALIIIEPRGLLPFAHQLVGVVLLVEGDLDRSRIVENGAKLR